MKGKLSALLLAVATAALMASSADALCLSTFWSMCYKACKAKETSCLTGGYCGCTDEMHTYRCMILFEQCVEGCNNDYCFGEVSHQPGEKGLSIWLAGGQSVDPTRMSFDPIAPVGCPNESTIAGGVGD